MTKWTILKKKYLDPVDYFKIHLIVIRPNKLKVISFTFFGWNIQDVHKCSWEVSTSFAGVASISDSFDFLVGIIFWSGPDEILIFWEGILWTIAVETLLTDFSESEKVVLVS